jgi:ABC-type transport system involved in multi-copper enzyme maturation permease subunit
MKFLAILKDSLREAIDSKVFYVTVGMSCLLILLVGSVSFKPLPADEALNSMINSRQFGVIYADRGHSPIPANFIFGYEIKDLEKLNDAAEPQAGDYRFRFKVRNASQFRHAVHQWSLPEDAIDHHRGGAVEVEDAGEPVPGQPADPAKEKRRKKTEASDELIEEFLKYQFNAVGNVEVTSVTPLPDPSPDTLVLQVETKGTKAPRGWQHDPYLFFGTVPLRFLRTNLGFAVYWIQDGLVNGIGAWVTVLLGVVITAFFIPNMLRKGTVDLLIVKPIHRSTLLVYKYVGGLTFIFLNSAIAVGGIWLVLGLRSGIWATGFLLTIFILTFFFAILYAASTLFSVLTRSAIASILLTCFVWFLFWLVGVIFTALDTIRDVKPITKDIPSWVYPTVDSAHYVLPRTKDLDVLTTRLLCREVLTEGEIRQRKLDPTKSITWGESLTVSGVFIALMLSLACWRFAVKDY